MYLSLFFKQYRQEYYDKLNAVRSAGDWEGWLIFFLTGVIKTANQAVVTSRAISRLFDQDALRIRDLKRAAISALRIHEILREKTMITVARATSLLNVTQPTARSALSHLAKLGIVREISGRKKGKVYVYTALVELLEQGIENSHDHS